MIVDIDLNTPELDELVKKLSPDQLDGALKVVGEGLLNLVRDHFRDGVDPYGDQWQDLKESTLEAFVRPEKRRRDYGTDPLIVFGFSGGLAGSFSYKVTNGQLELGSPREYAKYHQGDSDHPSKGIVPQRRMLPTDPSRALPDDYRAEIIDSLEAHLGLS